MRLPSPRRSAAALALVLAVGLLIAWEPTAELRARSRVRAAESAIANRDLHVSAAELAALMRDRRVSLALYDLRHESAYNRFHLLDAQRLVLDEDSVRSLRALPERTVKVLVADDEASAERAVRTLLVAGIRQAYLLEGGIASWRRLFPEHEQLLLAGALGGRHPLSGPGSDRFVPPPFEPKVKVPSTQKRGPGGCGG